MVSGSVKTKSMPTKASMKPSSMGIQGFMAISTEPRALEMSSPPMVTIANLKKIEALLKVRHASQSPLRNKDIPLIFRCHVRHHRPNNRERDDRTTTTQPRQRRQPYRTQREDIREPQHDGDYGGIQDNAGDTEANGPPSSVSIREQAVGDREEDTYRHT